MLTAAFATVDGIHVDAHFGRCARFDIYDITAESVKLREIRSIATTRPTSRTTGCGRGSTLSPVAPWCAWPASAQPRRRGWSTPACTR